MTRLGGTALYCYSVITVAKGYISLSEWEKRWMRADKKKFETYRLISKLVLVIASFNVIIL